MQTKLIGLQWNSRVCVLCGKILKKTLCLAVTHQLVKHSGIAPFIFKTLVSLE